MIKINLLSEGKKPVVARKSGASAAALKIPQQDLALWILVGCAILALIGVGAYWMVLRNQLAQTNDQIATAQKEIEALKPILAEVEDYKHKKEQLEHKISVINDLKANQSGPVQIMDYVSRALPELLWIDRMDMRGKSLALRGRAFNTNAIALFLENLAKVPEFSEPVLRDMQKRGTVYNYDIGFSFNFAKPAAETPAAAGSDKAGAAAATPAPAGKG